MSPGAPIVVRAGVDLGDEVVERLRHCLSTALGRDVTLDVRADDSVHGAVIVLDERRQIAVDLDTRVNELEQALEDVRFGDADLETQAGLIAESVESLPLDVPAAIGETNLRAALGDVPGGTVTLCSRLDVDNEMVERLRQKLCAAAGRDVRIDLQVDPRMEDGVALLLHGDRRIVLDPRYQWIGEVERRITGSRRDGLFEPEEAFSFLRGLIETTEPELRVEELRDTGHVQEVGDGIAIVTGLRGVGSQELVEFEGGVFSLALSLQSDAVGCILLGSDESVQPGEVVRRTGHLLRVPTGHGLLGRVVDSLGRPIDGLGPVEHDDVRLVEAMPTGVVDRQPVTVPLHTGIKVVDALVPLGRGQRELIIGDRKVGKTTLAVDTILSQKEEGVLCVYAAVGQRASSVTSIVRTFEEHGALEYTAVVASLPGEPPAFRYLAPYTACAIAEHFMHAGRDVLVVYDDLSKHAVTYREMSALLNRPIGREAYPGDVFYLHSRLLERAARLSDELGGGSMTALPIVETQAGDISAFIPTNVISICDGQMFLETALFNEGFRPALDVGLSVSRVGGAAQTRAMKEVSGTLRIDLAQYYEMAQFVKFGAEVDDATLRQLQRGKVSRRLLTQDQHESSSTAETVAVLYAVTHGFLEGVDADEAREYERRLKIHLHQRNEPLMRALDDRAALTEEIEAELTATLGEFRREWTAGSEEVPA